VSVLATTRTALGDAARDARRSWSHWGSAAVAAVGLAAVLPLLAPSLRFDSIASSLYLALAATGLAFAVGLAGIPSLGQGAFMGIGAFGAALLQAKAGWPAAAAIVIGTLVAAAAGLVTGLGVVRLRGVLVAVGTWILTWLVALALAAFPELSGGSQGLVVPAPDLSSVAHYELALGLVALAILAFFALRRGAVGLALASVRQQPDAAVVLGVPVARLRLGAFVASAAIGGLAGALAVQLAGVADPGEYGPFRSFELFVAVMLGGATAAGGGLAGIGVLALLARAADPLGRLEAVSAERLKTLLAAVILLLVLGLGDEGAIPALRRRLARAAHPTVDVTSGAPLAAEGTGRLAGRGLTKRYGAVAAADGVDVELAPGEIHALLGPNGSGKTTVLRLLTGFLRPQTGAVTWNGAELTRLTVRERALTGVVATLQTTAVFPELTALENVLVGAGLRRRFGGSFRTLFSTPRARGEDAETRRDASAALAAVGLERAANVRAEELPAFDRRLLMVASALATKPQALLLDEPAAGASARELESFAGVLARLREEGLGILLVEHNLRLVRAVADRATVLEAGRVIARGTPEEVGRDPAVRAAYLGRQRLGHS
jgi:branched-chain amino acid transport system permease protein